MLKKLWLILVVLFVVACNKINIYERIKLFSTHSWQDKDRPSFIFNIEDTTGLYNIFVVFRHSDAYNYNNVWLKVTTIPPGDTAATQALDLRLADNKNGWLGSGMDDIFEHRIKITRAPVRLKAGKYSFTLQHIMREEPLQHVMSVGVRVEKVLQ